MFARRIWEEDILTTEIEELEKLDASENYARRLNTYIPHKTLITSSSRKPSCEVEMPRNTRENMNLPRNIFDRQHARRDRDELQNDSRNLERIEKSGSEEPLQSIPLPCFLVRAEKSQTTSKSYVYD